MSKTISASMEGYRLFRHRFANNYKNVDRKFIKHLRDSVEMVFDQSQVYVPVDEGDLKGSGEIVTNRQDKRVSSYSIRYGDGLDHKYALIVEKREFAPSGALVRHDAPTRAWYVSQAWKDKESVVREKMRRAVHNLNANLPKA